MLRNEHAIHYSLRENQGTEHALDTIVAQKKIVSWTCPLAHVETLAGDFCFYISVTPTLVRVSSVIILIYEGLLQTD